MNYKNKSFMTKRKAFTLIELLIVIAIIGILFIVLISKVDFATDKSKATGVQTDFRSFQVAFDTVAKENAGFNTFGWDTGDTNGNRIRDSYDKGDTNQNGKQDEDEIFIGSKTYGETWTGVYTLVKPGTTGYDVDAIAALESAINKNLDPKLHITIGVDGVITMANGAKDPWKTEYHGVYLTNAENDKKDRGAIIMYSNGANQEWGSEHNIANGVISVTVPGNNVYGKDDYSIAVVYTYVNGYGEVQTSTSGFSNNQTTQGNISNNYGTEGSEGTEDPDVTELLEPGLYNAGAIELAKTGDVEAAQDMIKTSWDDLLAAGIVHVTNGVVYGNFDFDAWENASSDALDGDLVLPNDGSIKSIGDAVWDEDSQDYIGNMAFPNCYNLTGIAIPKGVTKITDSAFACTSLTNIIIPNSVTIIDDYAFYECTSLSSVTIGNSVTSIGDFAFAGSYEKPMSLVSVTFVEGSQLTSIGECAFFCCTSLTRVTIPDGVTELGESVFRNCTNLTNMVIPDSVTSLGCGSTFLECTALESIIIPDSITIIPEYTFSKCSSLTSITIPNSITSIYGWAFYECTSLESITIGNSVTSIDVWAFYGCTSLTSVTIPDSVTTINDGAFKNCTSITGVTIGEGVTNIGYHTFQGCSNLTSITIPDSVTEIDDEAFADCKSLTNITFNGSIEQWSSIYKMSNWNNGVPATYVQCTDGQVTF